MPCFPSTSDQIRASSICPTAAAPWLSSSFSVPRGSFKRLRPSAIEPEETIRTSRPSPCSFAMSATSAASHDAFTSPLAELISSDEPTFTTMRRKFLSAGRFMAMGGIRQKSRCFAAGGGPSQAAMFAGWLFRAGRSVWCNAQNGREDRVMNCREFVAGGLALSAAAKAGPAWAQSGPLTRIVFPFAAGGSGDLICRLTGAISSRGARPQFHRREPHRR